jgi:UDP-N-acetylglucosamine 2-epimerase (non-hydrolysing)
LNLEGKRILVTGGTGSLGQTLVRRLLTGERGQPAKVIVFSRDEAKQHYMRLDFQHRAAATDDIIYQNSSQILGFRIGDVRDYGSFLTALRESDVVFHAAALKQVPTCEYFPYEAVQTNVIGPSNLVRAIRENDTPVEVVVGISTDKACKPVNVMGMTKALQERILLEANIGSNKAKFVCVRYGNVIASRGSVVPLFVEQIRRGGPVTITLREMTRFLLTLDRAVDTVFAAVDKGEPGETYIPRVPTANVADIARALMTKEVQIVYTGVRPGEKIHEVMVSEEERFRTIERDGYYVILPILPELRDQRRIEPVLAGEYSSEHDNVGVEELCGDRSLRVMRVVTIFGTRPEIIRLCRILPLLDRHCEHVTVHTGQNYEENLSDIFLRDLDVRQPDVNLGARTTSFAEQTGTILAGVDRVLVDRKPDRVLILGDTNSALSSIVAARRGIPVFHMEAGNRCYDDRVPEEVNRRIVDHSSTILLPYTMRSKENLVREGIERDRIFVTGNPIHEVLEHFGPEIDGSGVLDRVGVERNGFFLATMHRAENVDEPRRLDLLLQGLSRVADEHAMPMLVSVHPRTASRLEVFGVSPRSARVRLLEPLGFFDFVRLEKNARLVLSDSGTVQEECAIFNVPNVTIRDVTERPETIECGSNILSGADPEAVARAAELAMATGNEWAAPAEYLARNVSRTVTKIVLGYLSLRRHASGVTDPHPSEQC